MSLIHGVPQSTGWWECSISEWQVSETVLEKPDQLLRLKGTIPSNWINTDIWRLPWVTHSMLHTCVYFGMETPGKWKLAHLLNILNLSISRMFSEWGTCSLVSKNVLPWSGVAKPPDIKLLETNLSSNLPLNTSPLSENLVWHGIPSLMWGPVTGWCQSPVGISSSSDPGLGLMTCRFWPSPSGSLFPHTPDCKIYRFFTSFILKWQIIWSSACLITSKKGLKSDKSNLSKTDKDHSDAMELAWILIWHFIGFLCFARNCICW